MRIKELIVIALAITLFPIAAMGWDEGALDVQGRLIKGSEDTGLNFDVNSDDLAEIVFDRYAAIYLLTNGGLRFDTVTSKMQYSNDGGFAWADIGSGGSGAPTDADYLVGTANGDLSNEIVAGATPQGFMGGTWASPTAQSQIIFTIDGGGSAITTGEKTSVRIPYAGTLTGWDIVADQASTSTIDVWVDSYANYPPTNADSITNAHEPTISASIKGQDTDISDWSDVENHEGDYMTFNIDANDVAEKLVLTIYLVKT